MKIYIASDHAGWELKEILIPFLKERGHQVEDMGAGAYNKDDDYPDFITPLAARVSGDQYSFGIVIGHSGQGEAMVANRVRGVRCALYYATSADILRLSREHNNANVLSLGAHFITPDAAKQAIDLWLSIPFPGEERHVRRLSKFN